MAVVLPPWSENRVDFAQRAEKVLGGVNSLGISVISKVVQEQRQNILIVG